MTSFAKNATVVLVHGAWADGSSWSKVIAPLVRSGLKVVCAPLPLTNLGADIEAVATVVEKASGPVILVGHAYAGAVISAVDMEQVVSLVFVAALAPDEGETVAAVFSRDEKHANAPELAPDSRGLIWMPDVGFEKAFAQNATDQEKLISAAIQRPISVACIQEPVSKPTWKKKPSWFFVAEEDQMINPLTQRFMAERMGAQVRTYEVDHTPSITAPESVIEVILEAARSTLSV